MQIKIKKLHPDAVLPKYATELSAGFDLIACEDEKIYPGQTEVVKLGFAIEIPEGFEMQIRPRSGNSLKTDIRIANSPGTIDADYRGEVGVIIDHKRDRQEFHNFAIEIKKGQAIAQGIIARVEKVEWLEVEELSSTERGAGGYGSTDKK